METTTTTTGTRTMQDNLLAEVKKLRAFQTTSTSPTGYGLAQRRLVRIITILRRRYGVNAA